MGSMSYDTTAFVWNKELVERFKMAYFVYKVRKEYIPPFEDEPEIHEYEMKCFDLAVLFGLRDTCFGTDGDTPLNDDELKILTGYLSYTSQIWEELLDWPNKKIKTETIKEVIECNSEEDLRLQRGEMFEQKDGALRIELGRFYRSLWRALTTIYLGSRVKYIEDIDDEYGGGSTSIYMSQYGYETELSYKSYDYSDDSETYTTKKRTTTTENDEVVCRSLQAQSLIKSGKIDEAIQFLEEFKDKQNDLNDLGTLYWDLGDYKKAYEYYKESLTETALSNILDLYLHKLLPLDVEDCTNVCEQLIKVNKNEGYEFAVALYEGKRIPELRNNEKVIQYAKAWYKNDSDSNYVKFEYAYYLHAYGWTKRHLNECRKLYEELLCDEYGSKRARVYSVSAYNYARLYLFGDGCDKDVFKAIYYLKLAYEYGMAEAALRLRDIYKNEEGFISEVLVEFWENKYKETINENE